MFIHYVELYVEKGAHTLNNVEKNQANRPIVLIFIAVVFIICLFIFLTQVEEGESYSSNEEQLANLLSEIHGVGQVQVYFHYDQQSEKQFLAVTQQEKLSGVIIVAQGAKNADVKIMLKETVGHVLQIPSHRIQVVPMQIKEENK
ncbi:hypothetical protein ACTHOQ_10930 [Solibacillus silvestris]|uniref:hypothetical protein n=1 Tax=Solibacillus silvestris TaxID=76853 RepID=UPI003F7E84EC